MDNQQFELLMDRFDGMDKRLDSHDEKMAGVERTLRGYNGTRGVVQRLESIEDWLGKGQNRKKVWITAVITILTAVASATTTAVVLPYVKAIPIVKSASPQP